MSRALVDCLHSVPAPPCLRTCNSPEVDGRSIIQRCGARTHTETQGVRIVRYCCVILELVCVERVERVSDLCAAADERVQNIQTRTNVLGDAGDVSPIELKSCFV